MPDEYGSLKLKVPKAKGEGANAPQAFKDFSDSIIEPATGAEDQIAIVQADGSIAYKAIKGDATMEADGTLALASPNNSVYRTLLAANQWLAAEQAIITTPLGVSAGAVNLFAGIQGLTVPLLYLAAADYTVAGKAAKLRLRAQAAVNGTKPGTKFVFSLRGPLGAEGGAGNLTLNGTGAVAGSSLEMAEPAASGVAQVASGDFALPADGTFLLAVETFAKLAAGSRVLLNAQLQLRHV